MRDRVERARLAGGQAPADIADDIMALLSTTQSHGAYPLLERISAGRPQRLHPNSVYRALRELRARGNVLHIATTRKYVLRAPDLHPPLLLLLCRSCGAVVQLEAHGIAEAVLVRAAGQGFRPSVLCLELVGRCPRCLAAGEPQGTGGRRPGAAEWSRIASE